ncbi:phosphoglycolate phosphatase [Kribbella amoyensis]|uniref:Phosphoglycolate phosphatase n=1 Tax=Kribbella amoyensis TaxID=996641 RepID=A0A561BMD3_9ACTN|nr:HAD family hydrolase [Kribbella amoyensis]TWD79998.1 phosphoglycolate phosphatase [Kribbella amoyensis]
MIGFFERAKGVLLDFDGPVADLFPSGYTGRIGDAVREPLVRAGVELPEPVATSVDHLVVLRFAAAQARDQLEEAERIAVEAEVEAARTAPVTAGAAEFLDACTTARLPITVVSNNAAPAIDLFLQRHGFVAKVGEVVGRPFARPESMKPSPRMIEHLAVDPAGWVMIGDSASDVEFARRIGAGAAIGYAKTPRHHDRLSAADVVTESMAELADAVLQVARRRG